MSQSDRFLSIRRRLVPITDIPARRHVQPNCICINWVGIVTEPFVREGKNCLVRMLNGKRLNFSRLPPHLTRKLLPKLPRRSSDILNNFLGNRRLGKVIARPNFPQLSTPTANLAARRIHLNDAAGTLELRPLDFTEFIIGPDQPSTNY